MKILIAEWKAWQKWKKVDYRADSTVVNAAARRVIGDEIELLPEEYKSYTEYRAYMKTVQLKKRVYKRKKDESNQF